MSVSLKEAESAVRVRDVTRLVMSHIGHNRGYANEPIDTRADQTSKPTDKSLARITRGIVILIDPPSETILWQKSVLDALRLRRHDLNFKCTQLESTRSGKRINAVWAYPAR